MKRTIEILLRLFAPPARLAALILAVIAAGGAWAAVPVPTVVWESREFDSSKTGTDGQTYSISRNNLHTINGSGNIVIGEGAQGVTINLPSNPSDSVSVLVKYSSTTTAPVANAALATIYMSAQYDIGAIVRTSGSSSVNGYYSSASKTEPEKATYTFSSGLTLSQGSGVMLLSHGIDTGSTVRGTAFYTGATVSSMTAGGNVDALQWKHASNNIRTISTIAIGGPTRNNVGVNAWNGMVIEKIAVFVNRYYTGTELADYRWPSEIKEVLPDRDMINLNISNDGGYAITGSGVDTIPTLAGEMLDNAWQNTPSGHAVVSGDARNGRVTGVTAYDGTSKEATTLSDVTFTWAVEGSGTANYGNVAIENNPTFHKAWLARLNKAVETSSILVQSIPYRKYDIIVYCFGADVSAFNPVFVNGVSYVGDTSLATDTKTRKATSSSETWGGRRASPSLGQTAIMLKGLENPELSLTIRSGATSICAVQILRDMSEGVWPTSKKVISLNLMSAKSSSGTTPAIYGLEPVPDAAWTKDGLSTISSSGTDVSATIMEWNGSSAVEASGVTVNEKAANAHNWSGYSYTPQNQILSGYLDDTSRQISVTVTSVPYAVYDVIVYTATDTENYQFGPVTVNRVSYRWDDESGETVVADSADSTTTTRWGASRSRLPAYGRNAIRIPNQTSSTLTITGANNANSARGGIAAIQIVEAYSGLKVYSNGSWSGGTEPTSGDATIVVDGDTALAIDGTASLDTVTITGTGTLTLSGSGKFTATTIEVESLATVNANPDRLDATTYVGSGTVVYSGGAPEKGKGWTDSANWTGTVEIKGKAATTPTLKLADYGNSESAVCVNGFEAYISLDEGAHAVKELKIGSGGFTQVGDYGYNATKDFVIPAKLTGTGAYTVATTGNAKKSVNFQGDTSEFAGKIVFDGSENNSRVVFGASTSRAFQDGSIVIGANGILKIAYPMQWSITKAPVYVDQTGLLENTGGLLDVAYGFKIDGTLKTPGIGYAWNKMNSYTGFSLGDTGVLELTSTGSVDESNSNTYNYGNVTGTGTIKFNGAGYRGFPYTSPADTLSIVAEQADGLVFRQDGKVIGSLSGTKNLRSDLGDSGKTLTIKQAKDGVWSGIFKGGTDRLATIVVAPGDSTTGTLTLAGTQDQANWTDALTVSGSVNLTGTWQGDTTVSGTFGGTGTLTGNLTFSAGSTFKAFASDTDGLVVSGTVTCPAEGTVTVDVSALTETTGKVVLMTATNATFTAANFALAIGNSGELVVEDYALKVDFTAYAASYGGVKYETVQEAIDAAVEDGHTYEDVTILDNNAACPDGYYVDTGDNDALKMYQAAIVKSDESKVYFKTAQLAFDDIAASTNLITYMQGYVCVEVYYGTDVAISINASATIWTMGLPVKIRCLYSATVSVTTTATESTLTAGAAENGIVTYSSTPVATTYVWAGTAGTAANWSSPAKWKVGSAEGETASRAPGSTDTVVFSDGASVSGVSGISVAALQVSGTVTFTGGGSLTSANAITLGTGDSITITGTLSPVPATTVANSYVKATTSDSTTTYRVDAYNTVTFAGDNYTLGSVTTNGAAVAVSESTCKVEDGAITFTVAPNNGYAVTGVTAGGDPLTADNGTYSYTVADDVTITVTTVSTSLTIGAATVEYLADYSMAKTVSATVTDGTVLEGTTWTLKTNGVAVVGATATYADGTVTFSDISVTLGDSITYSIEASNGSTGTSAESAASTVGSVTGGWIVEDSTHTGTGATGAWTTLVAYSEGVAAITDNTYTPTKPGNGIVTLETVVKFGNEADSEVAVGDGAQAAVKIANGKFAVYGKATSDGTAGWQSTEVVADVDATYAVKLIINYNTGTFTISVKKNGAETATPLGSAWHLATAATKVSSIAYKGTGAFTSLNGSFISGDVDVTVDETGVAVSSDFISKHLAGKTVAEAAAALAPDATPESNPAAFAAGGNGLNYFTSYALGLDPTKTDDKPIVDVTTDTEGKFVFTVKHPVYNEQGAITGYEEINAADNVSTTVTLKYGTDASSITTVESGAATGISPADMFEHAGAGNVIYYKAEVSIGAK